MRKDRQRQHMSYDARIARKRLVLILSLTALLIASFYAVATGSIPLRITEILHTFIGDGDDRTRIIIFGNRLPRTAAALLTGAILSVSGVVMQCVLHNPLASASTLGVSQGAAFGAALGIIVFGGGVVSSSSSNIPIEVSSPYIVTLCAFLFGSVSSVVILVLSRMKQNLGPGGLVLAGVALSSLFTGGSTLLQYFADETKISAVVFWTFGNLGGASWKELGILAAVFLFEILYFMLNRWNFNAMQSGMDTAKSLGVNTRALMLVSMTICSFAAAVAVAFVGIINFIGLVAPHMMRRLLGDDYRYLIPCSAVAGAFILLAADTFGRLIISPVILPVGAITSFLGAPAFLALLLKGADDR